MQNIKLILFTKAPILGKIKTRLAEKLGIEKAFEINNHLYNAAHHTSLQSGIPLQIYLSEEIKGFAHPYKLQRGNDLGEKMFNAFATELKANSKVCIIGSDCLELTPTDIRLAYELLEVNDVVLGPANDGGYYLIGLKTAHKELFLDINWGTSEVLEKTLKKCILHNLTYSLLPPHNDVDRPEDVPARWL